MRFIRDRSGTLFSSSSSCSRNLGLLIENNHFRVLYPVFFFFYVFKEKLPITTTIMLCIDDTLHEEDVLVSFDELEVQTSAS